jgi:hypothetical protein
VGKLVGGKNMSWSIGMMNFPTEGEKKPNVPNHHF